MVRPLGRMGGQHLRQGAEILAGQQGIHGGGGGLNSHASNSTPMMALKSASALSGSSTLMVRMPMAAAGFRLMPRSSRKTASAGAIPSRRSEERRVGKE